MEETLGGHSEETNAPIAMDGDGGDLIDDVMLEGYEPPKRLVYTERRLREMQEVRPFSEVVYTSTRQWIIHFSLYDANIV